MAAMKHTLLVAFVFGALLSGCGPFKSTEALFKAHQALKRAEIENAGSKRPYELTLAQEYYNKAREEAGYSEYEMSERLAAVAERYARIAAGEPLATPPPEALDPSEELP
jgi:hypothetical protein